MSASTTPGCPSDGGEERADIIGSSPGLLAALANARKVARTNIPVLIIGETGTGKDLLAHLIHKHSKRPGCLVPVDCGAIPDELAESILFGHRRGAFTGAVEHFEGLIPQADGGTLFLDELGSLSVRGQAKLLRVLETGVVQRVGDARANVIRFRLVCTAQVAPEALRGNGFRADLLQRAACCVIRLPSLRERGTDVALLAQVFAEREGLRLDQRAVEMLAAHHWPGNVRELKWTLSLCALFATGSVIDGHAVTAAIAMGPWLGEADARVESRTLTGAAITDACRAHDGDPDRAASALGISRSTLYRRLRDAGLRLEMFRRKENSA